MSFKDEEIPTTETREVDTINGKGKIVKTETGKTTITDNGDGTETIVTEVTKKNGKIKTKSKTRKKKD